MWKADGLPQLAEGHKLKQSPYYVVSGRMRGSVKIAYCVKNGICFFCTRFPMAKLAVGDLNLSAAQVLSESSFLTFFSCT